MNKKKLVTLVLAGMMTVGVVGGTLAWFTSEDSINNVFKTGSVTDPEDGLEAGIDVQENFPGSTEEKDTGDMVYGKPVTPNQTLTKEVWVESKANYNQIVRARVVKNFIDPDTGGVVTHWAENTEGKIEYGDSTLNGAKPLDLSYIVLAENLNGNPSAPEGWTVQLNGIEDTSALKETNWYYYNEVVEPHEKDHVHPTLTACRTTDLLKTVTLSKDAGNEYKNLRFDVKVEAESIQATNGAIENVWQNVPEKIKDLDPSVGKAQQ